MLGVVVGFEMLCGMSIRYDNIKEKVSGVSNGRRNLRVCVTESI